MSFYTPIFGSELVKRPAADLGPLARICSLDELDAVLPGAKRLAEQADPGRELDWCRESVSRMTGQLLSGGTLSPERAREIAVAAARRHDGEAVDYRQRSQ